MCFPVAERLRPPRGRAEANASINSCQNNLRLWPGLAERAVGRPGCCSGPGWAPPPGSRHSSLPEFPGPLPSPLEGGGEVERQPERTWEQASRVLSFQLPGARASAGGAGRFESRQVQFRGLGPCSRGLLPRLAAVRWRFPGLCVSKQGSWQLVWKPPWVLRGAAHMHTQSLQSKLSESPGLRGSSKVTQQVHGGPKVRASIACLPAQRFSVSALEEAGRGTP